MGEEMSALILRNSHFDVSPIMVELNVKGENGEGWRDFTLRLTAGEDSTNPMAECVGSMSREDFTFFAENIDAASRGGEFEFSPLESWFILRVREYSEQEVELLWVVDQGMAKNKTGTDTGVGVLMIVGKTDLADAFNRMLKVNN